MPIRSPLQSELLRRTARALAFSALILPGLASAAANCTVPPGNPDDATLDRLLDELPQCQRDAQYLAGIGNILNKRGRYAEAADHLERALMLAPELKGAELDYAIALAGTGEIDSARMLLDQVLADPTLPAQLRPALEKQRAEWASANAWHTRVIAGARIGHDSNLLGSPNLTTLTLTFPEASVVLPLDESARPKSGLYTRLDLQLEAHKQTETGGQVDAFLGLRARHAPSTSAAASHHVDAALEYNDYRLAATGHGFYLGATAATVRGASGLRYDALGVSAGGGTVHWLAGCDARVGLDAQDRRYLNNDLLSGRYGGLAASLTCDRQTSQWLLSVKAGRDLATHWDRPGGNQDQYDIRGAVILSSLGRGWFGRGRLWLDLELAESRDATSYSPLLESGRSRVVRREIGRMEYQRPLTASAQWVAGVEAVLQQSNLALFASRSWGPYLAIRAGW